MAMVHGFQHVSVARSDRSERGAVAIVVALMMVVFLGFSSVIVDLGNARQLRRKAQAGADAAALAGTEQLLNSAWTWPSVILQVEAYAQEDMGTPLSAWTGCSDPQALAYAPDVTDTDTCISSDSPTVPTEIRVQLPVRTVPTVFGGILGVSATYVAAAAKAAVNDSVACALCVINPTSTALTGSGSGAINITGGGLVVNSTSTQASTLSGHALATALGGAIGGPAAPGGFQTTGGASYSPAPVEEPPVPDPFSTIPECPAAGTSVCPTTTYPDVTSNGTSVIQTLSPGIYGNISATNGGSLVLNPGTYIITGSFSLTGLGTLTATGVTLYFACSAYPTPCSPGESGASLTLNGNGLLSLSPPTSGVFQGLTVFYDRNNTASSSITGNGGTIMGGSVYMASGALTVDGNGSVVSTLNSMIVANTVTVSGNGALSIADTPTGNVPVRTVQLSQ